MSIDVWTPSHGAVQLVPVWPNAGAPTSGTSGSFAGLTQKGDLLVDTTTGATYQNTGTTASPTWSTAVALNQAAVAITGGTINGTTLGATTPAAATVTKLVAAGAVGSGAGAGDAQSITGGQGGATGAGGAASLVGGAGGASSGNGAASNVTGGAGTAGNGSGGSAVLTGGAKNGTGIAGGVRIESIMVRQVSVPAAKTVSATLTAAELLSGIITINQGASGASAQQSPTGTAIQAALPTDFATGDSFDVNFINLSSDAAEIATLTVNTDVTIVGTPDVASIAAGVASQGTFRFRKTANHVFVAYRIQ